MRLEPEGPLPGPDEPSALRTVVERFEEAWQAGRRPCLDDHLPPGPGRRPALLELAHIDLEWRLKAGEAARVEDYLARFPELAEDTDAVQELIAAEYGLRRRSEPHLGVGEYGRRFPALAAALAERLGPDPRADGPTIPSTRVEGAAPETPSAAPFGPPGAAPAAPANGGARYRPVRFHAKGGLGEVHVAADEELHREVALKRIQPRFAGDAGSRARFLREAEITARLEHPGVVPVHGLVHDADGRPCYAMRFIQGQTLAEAARAFHEADKAKRDPGERAVALRGLLGHFVAVCNTIAYAHSRGVLHRDLKPANVMLGPYGETLVLDWGLAGTFDRGDEARASGEESVMPSADSAEETPAGEAMGTPAYMAPEQAAGRWDLVGPAGDVYSLGATLYELLTGVPPFQGPVRARWQRHSLLERVKRGEFPPPRQANGRVPAALEAICLQAMALRPADRYPTPRDLADDVERWLADAPVGCYREPLLVSLTRWGRRHKEVVAGAFTLLLTLVVGLAAGNLLLSREQAKTEAARKDEEEQKLKAWELEQKARQAAAEATQARHDAEAAQKEEAAAAGRARAEADKATKVSRFFEEVLRGADPLGLGYLPSFVDTAASGKLTVREAVDRGAARIDTSLRGEPQVRAALKEAIGHVYRTLGAYDKAREQLESALELRRRLPGRSRDLDLAASLHSLGWWHQDRGDYYEAERLFSESLELRRKHLPEDDPLVASCHFHLGWVLGTEGRLAEADRLFAQALASRRRHFDEKHPEVAMTYLAQAFMALERGRTDEAAAPAARGLTLLEQGPAGRRLAGAVGHLLQGMLLKEAGLLPLAEGRLRKGLQVMREVVGPGHPYEAFFLYELADTLDRKGDAAGAEREYRQCIEFARRTRNGHHPKILVPVYALARLLARTGRYAEGEALFDEVLAEQRRFYKPDCPFLSDTLVRQAAFAAQNGRYERAEGLARRAYAGHRKAAHPTVWTAHSARLLGQLHLRQKRFAEAAPLLEEALGLLRRELRGDSAGAVATEGELGRALLGQKQFAEAERLLRHSAELGRAKFVSVHDQRFQVDTLVQLAEVCFQQERYDEAVTAYLEAFELFLKVAPEADRRRADLLTRPFVARLVEKGQYRAALPVVERAQRLAREAKEPEVRAREAGHFVLRAELYLAAASLEERAAVCERLCKERPAPAGKGEDVAANVLAVFGGADVRACGWFVNRLGKKPWHVPVLAAGAAGLLATPAAPGPLLASSALLWRGLRVPARRNLVWGALAYRTGEYAEAVEALTAPPARRSGFDDAYADFFLAMAHHRLGRPPQARAALGRAVAWVETVQRGQLGENFLFERLELFLARREAESLLGKPGEVSFSRPPP
jgi:serine/threonine protein kinase